MKMLPVAFTMGVLLALVGGAATHSCVAPDQLVTELLQRLEDSVNVEEPPNPSVLLAMNLAGTTDGGTHKWLLQEIKEEVVKRAHKDMTSGQVALSVLALLSSCQNPHHVHALGETVDLLHILQKKTQEEMASMDIDGVPKTTLYSLSLDALGLCLGQVGHYEEASIALAKQVLSPTNHLSVDTRAMAALAMACTYNQTDLEEIRDLLWEAVSVVANGFLDEQEKRDGIIGNIYSMGLALQVLGSTEKFYAPREWDCAQAFSVVYSHDYRQPMAIAQVLPALVGKSYLEAASLNCATSSRMPPSQSPKLAPTGGHRGPTNIPSTSYGEDMMDFNKALIQVHYSIINKLQGKHFNKSISVWVPEGSTLLKVLQVAEEKEPRVFSFQTEQTSWGPMVVSIHGLAANPEDRTYWQFLSGEDALEEGVGTYKPRDGEHIQAIFSTY